MADLSSVTEPVSRVAIIGCGGIGALWGCNEPHGPILSHAGACLQTPGIQLVALCDPNRDRLLQCGEAYGVQDLFADFHQLIQKTPLDVLSICTPTKLRLPVFEAALQAGIRHIWCEKPLAHDLTEAERIQERIEGAHAVVAVNFLRRWDPGIQEVARRIRSGGLGAILAVQGRYSGGVLTNGSHLVDLLVTFFGAPDHVQYLREANPGLGGDPGLDFRLDFTLFSADMLAFPAEAYALFELDILGCEGRVTISQKGQRIDMFRVAPDRLHPQYRALEWADTIPSQLSQCMGYALEELSAIWRGSGQRPRCTSQDALVSLRVLEEVKQQWRNWRS